MKAIEQFFHVVLFIMLYKLVLTYKSVDERLVCDRSNESYWAVLSCGTVYYAVQGGSFLESVYETLLSDHSDKSVPGRLSDWSAFDAGCSDKSSWTNKIYMVLFTMLWKVVHFMTIQVKAMKEYFDELNNYKY